MGGRPRGLVGHLGHDILDTIDDCQAWSTQEIAYDLGSKTRRIHLALKRLEKNEYVQRCAVEAEPTGGRFPPGIWKITRKGMAILRDLNWYRAPGSPDTRNTGKYYKGRNHEDG